MLELVFTKHAVLQCLSFTVQSYSVHLSEFRNYRTILISASRMLNYKNQNMSSILSELMYKNLKGLSLFLNISEEDAAIILVEVCNRMKTTEVRLPLLFDYTVYQVTQKKRCRFKFIYLQEV